MDLDEARTLISAMDEHGMEWPGDPELGKAAQIVVAELDAARDRVAAVRRLYQERLTEAEAKAETDFSPYRAGVVSGLFRAVAVLDGEPASASTSGGDYVSTGDPADDHMIEGIPTDSPYQDTIEGLPSFRDRYAPGTGRLAESTSGEA